MKQKLWLVKQWKGMLFGCDQPFLSGERCVTSQKTAAKETIFSYLGNYLCPFHHKCWNIQNDCWQAQFLDLIPIVYISRFQNESKIIHTSPATMPVRHGLGLTWLDNKGVLNFPRDSGNSGWFVNGTWFFRSFHWKISGKNGNSQKVVPFSRWKFSDGTAGCSIYGYTKVFTSSRSLTTISSVWKNGGYSLS